MLTHPGASLHLSQLNKLTHRGCDTPPDAPARDTAPGSANPTDTSRRLSQPRRPRQSPRAWNSRGAEASEPEAHTHRGWVGGHSRRDGAGSPPPFTHSRASASQPQGPGPCPSPTPTRTLVCRQGRAPSHTHTHTHTHIHTHTHTLALPPQRLPKPQADAPFRGSWPFPSPPPPIAFHFRFPPGMLITHRSGPNN